MNKTRIYKERPIDQPGYVTIPIWVKWDGCGDEGFGWIQLPIYHPIPLRFANNDDDNDDDMNWT